MLVTVAVAAFVGSWGPPDAGCCCCTRCSAPRLVAASASALNQWLERESDALMDRTADRPLPAGELSAVEVLAVGVADGRRRRCVSRRRRELAHGPDRAVDLVPLRRGLHAAESAHAGQHRRRRGRRRAAGADGLDRGRRALALSTGGLKAATLFLIVYLWQFPHFMAIAWIYRDQYAAAGLQMLTVVDPTRPPRRRAGGGRRAGAGAGEPVAGARSIGRTVVHRRGACCLAGVYLYCSLRFFVERSTTDPRGGCCGRRWCTCRRLLDCSCLIPLV